MSKTSGVPFSYPQWGNWGQWQSPTLVENYQQTNSAPAVQPFNQWYNPAGQAAAAETMNTLGAVNTTQAPNPPANPGASPAVASPGSLALGGVQTLIGLYGLAKLAGQEIPEYSASPELIQTQNAAAQNAKFGFSPQQKAAFDANMGINFNTTLANAKNLGGGSVSKSLAAILHGNTLGAYNNFAAQDFNNKRSNQQYSDNIGFKKQEIQDRNTTMAINRRNLLEQQYGAAASSGLTNMASSFNLGAALKYMG